MTFAATSSNVYGKGRALAGCFGWRDFEFPMTRHLPTVPQHLSTFMPCPTFVDCRSLAVALQMSAKDRDARPSPLVLERVAFLLFRAR